MKDADAETIRLMRDIDAEYRTASGLRERRLYSIFYSRVDPSPVMILGINPGGDPTTWTMAPGADEFCSDWQHDYVDCSYPIQAVMLPFLMSCLGISAEIVRRIPKTNVIFRRSSGVSAFTRQQGISLNIAASEAEPFLRRIVSRVRPKAIVFEGNEAFSRFAGAFCGGVSGRNLVDPVTTPNGRHPTTIFSAHEVQVDCLAGPISAFVLGHPSKYGRRAEFTLVQNQMAKMLTAVGDELRGLGPPRSLS